jgi:hypothetical protein
MKSPKNISRSVARDPPKVEAQPIQERGPARGVALGKKNREPRTEPKEPGTGTERTGTEKFGSCLVPDSWEPNYTGSFGSVLGYPKNRGNSTSTHIA